MKQFIAMHLLYQIKGCFPLAEEATVQAGTKFCRLLSYRSVRFKFA